EDQGEKNVHQPKERQNNNASYRRAEPGQPHAGRSTISGSGKSVPQSIGEKRALESRRALAPHCIERLKGRIACNIQKTSLKTLKPLQARLTPFGKKAPSPAKLSSCCYQPRSRLTTR